MSNTITILQDARDIIAKGWCRGDYKKGNRYCSFGAIAKAAGLQFKVMSSDDIHEPIGNDGQTSLLSNDPAAHAYKEAYQEVVLRLRNREDDFFCLDEWNDQQRSKKPVLALFDQTIKELKNEV